MISQTLEPQTLCPVADERGSGRFDIRTIPTPTIYTHIVTLIHRRTEDEVCFEVETTSIRFKDVLDAITWQKVDRKLFGYEIYEVLDCNDPF